ncbi:serine aminopeptidase domain-containing protein, partial [Staphylococcus sp. HMSC077H01]
ISPDTYIENNLSEGVCSDLEVMEKYKLDDLNAKQISMGLVFSIMDGVRYLKDNAQQFTDNILILHGKEDGLVSYVDSLQLYQEIGS